MKRVLKDYGTVLIGAILCCLALGCASHKVVMPQMDLPPEPIKPAIQSSVIVQNSVPWVAFSMNDTMNFMNTF